MKRIFLALFGLLAFVQMANAASNPSDITNVPTSAVLQNIWPTVNTNANSVWLGGYTTDNDGNGGNFRWTPGDTDTADLNTIRPTGATTGAWTRSITTLPCRGSAFVNDITVSNIFCIQPNPFPPPWGVDSGPPSNTPAFDTFFTTGANTNGFFRASTAVGAINFAIANNVTFSTAVGSASMADVLYADRDTCIGALCMTWLGLDQAELHTYAQDIWNWGTTVTSYIPPGTTGWNYHNVEAMAPGMGAAIVATPDAASGSDVTENTGAGRDACNQLHIGTANGCDGYRALGNLYSGSNNAAGGFAAGEYSIFANNDAFFGAHACEFTVQGSQTSCFGYEAGQYQVGAQDVTIMGSDGIDNHAVFNSYIVPDGLGNGLMTVTSVSAGTLFGPDTTSSTNHVTQVIIDNNSHVKLQAPTVIALGTKIITCPLADGCTGTGGTGTYAVNISQTVGSSGSPVAMNAMPAEAVGCSTSPSCNTALTDVIAIGANSGQGMQVVNNEFLVHEGNNSWFPVFRGDMANNKLCIYCTPTTPLLAGLEIANGTDAGKIAISSIANNLVLNTNGSTGMSILTGPTQNGNIQFVSVNSSTGATINLSSIQFDSSTGNVTISTPADLIVSTTNGLDIPKLSADPSAGPGAGKVRLYAIAGTGTSCSIRSQAGTSATATTVTANIGSGC